MKKSIRLSELAVGERGRVSDISVGTSIRRRLLDIGLIIGTKVECVGISPCGDPKAYIIRGAVIAIRNDDCHGITLLRGD